MQKTVDTLAIPTNTMSKTYSFSKVVKGLAVTVRKSGHKAYVLMYRLNGKNKIFTIGDATYMKFSVAQIKALQLRELIEQGIDPFDLKQEQKEKQKEEKRASIPLNQFIELYIAKYAKSNKKSWKNDKTQLNHPLVIKQLHKLPLNKIKKTHIQELFDSFGERRTMANRVHACLRTVFNKAIEWGYIQTINPCTGIKHHKERPRRRKLGMNEVSRFLKALEDEKYAEYARYFFTVSLYHGLREPEVLGAKCSELDMDNNTWLIPADRTKESEDHIVQLTERTKDIFHSLLIQAKVNKTEFLFYNKKTKKPYQEVKKPWNQLRKDTDLEDINKKDLRRTFASVLKVMGYSLDDIGYALNHASTEVTKRHYAHLYDDPHKKMSADVDSYFKELMIKDRKPTPPDMPSISNVVRLNFNKKVI